jgi:hypothetical protein
MKYFMTFSLSVAAAVSMITLSGCKAAPATRPTPFLEQDKKLYSDPTCKAFQRVWVDPKITDKEWEKFTKIYIAPVNTDYVKKMEWWEQIDASFARQDSIKDLAKYMRDEFIKAHQNNSKKILKVVDKSDENTLLLELAITEVVPTKVWLNLASYTFIFMAIDQGVIAMEGRVRDGKNNKIVAMFMDRETGRTSILNIKDLTWYFHAKSIISEWAEQSVEVVNVDENQVVEDSCSFTLLPW